MAVRLVCSLDFFFPARCAALSLVTPALWRIGRHHWPGPVCSRLWTAATKKVDRRHARQQDRGGGDGAHQVDGKSNRPLYADFSAGGRRLLLLPGGSVERAKRAKRRRGGEPCGGEDLRAFFHRG